MNATIMRAGGVSPIAAARVVAPTSACWRVYFVDRRTSGYCCAGIFST